MASCSHEHLSMAEELRNILIAKRSLIVRDLQVEDVLACLMSKFVITEDENQRVLSEKTPRDQAKQLLDILLQKDRNSFRDAFKVFRESLTEKYSFLAKLLYTTPGGDTSQEGDIPMTKDHRDVLATKRVDLIENLLVEDILPYLQGTFVFYDNHCEKICVQETAQQRAGKLLDLLTSRGDQAFQHFVDSLQGKYTYLMEGLTAENPEIPSATPTLEASNEPVSSDASSTGSTISSEKHIDWIILGEINRLVRKPLAPYVAKIIQTWHAKLLHEESTQLGTCADPTNCLIQMRVQDLCTSCSAWYYKLLSSHRNGNESNIKWRKNCDTSKWSADPWEIAKFFMPVLGVTKSTVQDAHSTDLSSLLHVLEWAKDEVFGSAGGNRIPVASIAKLRSEVRNVWAHSPNQEITKEQLDNCVKVAHDFLDALGGVFSHEDVAHSRKRINSLRKEGVVNLIETKIEGLLQLCRELSEADFEQSNEDIQSARRVRNSDVAAAGESEKKVTELKKHVESITDQISKLCLDLKRQRDQQAQQARQAKIESCIPEKLSEFVGREDEIYRVINYVVEKHVGITSIVGGPGFGKSATAVEIAHRLISNHNIPVFFASLLGASTVEKVTVRLCYSLGVQPGNNPESSLIFILKNLKKRCVLVMDNVEQLLSEGNDGEFIQLLDSLRMHSNQNLQVLLTSRRILPPEKKSETVSLNKLDRNSSKQLVRSCCSERELNEQFVDSLAECCGDMPLALLIAAARIPDFTNPEELLFSLKESPFKVLTSGGDTLKVEKCIGMSFDRLERSNQNSYVRLSVFKGTFTKEAAESVTGLQGISVVNFLTSLVSRSLVERSSHNRYSLHPLIRSFLIECCEGQKFASERQVAKEKMVEYFLKRCRELTLDYWSKDGSNSARSLLEEDAQNIEKVSQLCKESVKTTADQPNRPIFNLLKKSEIYRFLSRFFYHFVLHVLSHSVVSSFLEAFDRLAEQDGNAEVEILAKCLTAHLVGRRRGWKSAEYDDSMELAQKTFLKKQELLGEKSRREVCSYYWYCKCWSFKEDPSEENVYEKAYSSLHKYLELKEENTDYIHLEKVDVVITLMQLGRVHRKLQKESCAADFYQRALKDAEELLGDHDLKLCCHKELGDSHFEQGHHERAIKFYEDAMCVHRELGATNLNISSVYLLKNYGLSLSNMSRDEEALVYLKQAHDIADKLFKEHKRCKTEIHCALAEIHHKRQSGCRDAVKHAKKAKSLNRGLSKEIDFGNRLDKIIDSASGSHSP